jgi:hypothetical protein
MNLNKKTIKLKKHVACSPQANYTDKMIGNKNWNDDP